MRENASGSIRIEYLTYLPEAVPILAAYFLDEWQPYYGPDGPGNAEEDIRACCRTDRIPLALVAVDTDGVVAGTGALKAESVGSEAGEEPWIAALMVEKSRRGNGIGTALIAALESEARRLGYSSVYSSTDAASRILQRRSWQEIRQVMSLRGPITVYRLDL